MSFIESEKPDFHFERKRNILAKYGNEIKNLIGNNPYSLIIILAIITLQFSMAYFLQKQNILVILAASYLIGAFCHHALYVFVHECAHNLVFKKTLHSKLVGILCDTTLVFPGAMAFRRYHLMHHQHMGDFQVDADICSEFEAKLVGTNPVKKTLWIFLLGVSQALRPMRLKVDAPFMDKWIFLNLVWAITINITAFYFLGINALIYFLASTIFALGLHPLGGRWIAEHYLINDDNQETYSYYGPINKVMFNIGYHTEHHDFMTIPWSNLPKLKKVAPDFYNNLHHHKSYTGLLIQFIKNKRMSLFSRVVREGTLSVRSESKVDREKTKDYPGLNGIHSSLDEKLV